MGTSIFPVLPGLTFPVTRAPVFASTIQSSVSGKETRIALQSYPRWKWDVSFSLLRSASAFTEFQELAGFFNSLLGQFDTFQYLDADDNLVVGQRIGTGDGVTTVFPLVRTFGSFVEPVLAPNTTAGVSVYLNGSITGAYSLSTWGSPNPGVITFSSAPASGVAITANINYYWPCRMSQDTISLDLFMSQYYALKKLSFISVKN